MSRDSDIIAIDNDDDDTEQNIPDAKSCQERVEKFVEITGTDEALAQFYLQDRNWDVALSVNAYFGNVGGGGADDSDLFITFDSKVAAALGGSVTTEPPKTFRLVTWNIDGLDERNLKKRTKAVAKILEEEKADIVYLQELVPQTYKYLEDHLPQFHFIVGSIDNYFTATLLRRTTVYYDSHNVLPFNNTCMGRELLLVQAHIGKVKLNLLNSHLESTKDFATQRKEQLKICFNKMKIANSSHTTLFGGDLNARDSEVDATKIPEAFDLWESCGRRPEAKWTWDVQRNTNKEFPGRFKPKARFDRLYLKQASPPVVAPKHFGLIGLQKVSGTDSFPSDHWGVIVHFEVMAIDGGACSSKR
ncbi:Tyrosyl-DNA phosphodiesterase 2 [Halocaridina rubra]|uniref:Tyrosyl-DNA phosphodiesterase 2 n=1 Tax=Halocaridina rubra TaxID=373956 RepID=A0AAN9AGY6_HALRR